jgi:hypothetical protein
MPIVPPFKSAWHCSEFLPTPQSKHTPTSGIDAALTCLNNTITPTDGDGTVFGNIDRNASPGDLKTARDTCPTSVQFARASSARRLPISERVHATAELRQKTQHHQRDDTPRMLDVHVATAELEQ